MRIGFISGMLGGLCLTSTLHALIRSGGDGELPTSEE